jgi:hypothetical protein
MEEAVKLKLQKIRNSKFEGFGAQRALFPDYATVMPVIRDFVFSNFEFRISDFGFQEA